MKIESFTISIVASICFMLTEGRKNQDIYCAVCRALVDEVDWVVQSVNPKKTIQVGSFRIDGDGNQNTYEKSYARSETHLTEVFESVCEKMNNYAQTTNAIGKKSIIRTSSRDGSAVNLQDISIDSESQKFQRYACNSLVEEHEDDMITLFMKKDFPDLEVKICAEIAGVCSGQDLQVPMPQASINEPEDDLTEEDETGEISEDEKEETEDINMVEDDENHLKEEL